MAHIKCRYFEYRCGHWKHKSSEYFDQCSWDGKAFCGDCKTDGVFDDACVYIVADRREFEKDVKSYRLCMGGERIEPDGFLAFRGENIDLDNVEYLEIDGRVLIRDGVANDR